MSFSQIDDDRAKFGEITSQELATELGDNIDFMNLLIPIGEVTPILVGLSGVPPVDANIWQECNGSKITNPNSPLKTIGGIERFTPDMRDRYIKVPTIFGESGDTGASNTKALLHDHGGVTGTFTSPEGVDQSTILGSLREAAQTHTHPIQNAFVAPVNIEPPFMTVKFFMRIQ